MSCTTNIPRFLLLNRRTYETYRFTVGDDLAVGRGDSQLDLAEARRTAVAFLV